MKALLALLAAGMVLVLPAAAAPWDYRPGLQGQDRRAPPQYAPGQREEKRDQRAAPQRDDRSRQRLSEEERRELRRDLDRANRELYRRKGQQR